MQDDALYGDLTVRTNLMFSALLRLPLSVSFAEKKQRVCHCYPLPFGGLIFLSR